MQIIAIMTASVLFCAVMSATLTFADSHVVLEPLPSSSTAGCELTEEGCYNMPVLTVSPGTEIIFSNTDTAAHVITAGTASHPQSNIFDSRLVSPGDTYTFTLEEEGRYAHFCLVHPWMTGWIIVKGGVEYTPIGNVPVSAQAPIPTPAQPITPKTHSNGNDGTSMEDKIRALEAIIEELKAMIKELTERVDSMTAPNATIRTHPSTSAPPPVPSSVTESYAPTNDVPYGLEGCEYGGLVYDGTGCVPDIHGYHIKVDKTEYTLGDTIHITGKIPTLTQEYETEYSMEGNAILQYVKLQYVHHDGTNVGPIGPYQPNCKIIMEINESSSWPKTCALTSGWRETGSITLDSDGTITTDLNVSAEDYRHPSSGSYLALSAWAYYGFDDYDMKEEYENDSENISLWTQPLDIVPLPPK